MPTPYYIDLVRTLNTFQYNGCWGWCEGRSSSSTGGINGMSVVNHRIGVLHLELLILVDKETTVE